MKNSQGLTEAGVCLKWESVGRNDDLKYVCINFVTRLGEHTGGGGGGGRALLYLASTSMCHFLES